MTLRRRDPARVEVSGAMRHFLETGCWAAADGPALELFLLAGRVIRGDVSALQALWDDVGAAVKAAHPARTYAEVMLAGGAIDAASRFGRTRCREHTAGPKINTQDYEENDHAEP